METLVSPDIQSVGGCILWGSDFVRWIQDTFLSEYKDDKNIPQLKKLKPDIPLALIIETVVKVMGGSTEDIIVKGRKHNYPRNIAIFLSVRLSNKTCTELGRYFGAISGSAIAICAKKCGIDAESDKGLNAEIEQVKQRIFDS